MLRFLTSGESHGPALVAILDGMPAGLSVDIEFINAEMARRQKGYGRGARQKIETDTAQILSGVRHGVTTGAPIALLIANRDFENWNHVMSTTPVDERAEDVAAQLAKKAIKRFRPGHADLAGTLKFRQDDIRDVLERASARETAARVAVGALCQQLLTEVRVEIAAHVTQVGEIKSGVDSDGVDLYELDTLTEDSELFCADEDAQPKMIEYIKKHWQEGDSLGGVVEVLADGLPIGLGSYTQWDQKLDGLLAQALMSVQAFKAVEIGDGVKCASLPGSLVHDALYPGDDESRFPFTRKTNHAGGIEGGMTNGQRLKVRAYMKPLPTLRKGLPSLSFPEYEADTAHYERSDVCAIAAASVVCKAMVAFVLTRAIIDKFGGDTMTDLLRSVNQFNDDCAKAAKPSKVKSATAAAEEEAELE